MTEEEYLKARISEIEKTIKDVSDRFLDNNQNLL